MRPAERAGSRDHRHRPCGRSLRELLLALRAIPRAWTAGRLGQGAAIDPVLESLLRRPGLSRGAGVDGARCAARRACRWVAWLGRRDSCLVRSLVLGSLIADRGDAALHIGFLRETSGALSGHAWVTLDGVNVSDDLAQQPPRPYVEARCIPLRRGT